MLIRNLLFYLEGTRDGVVAAHVDKPSPRAISNLAMQDQHGRRDDFAPRLAKPSHRAIPNVPVQDQYGRRYDFYADLVYDRVVMVNFFFTVCGDVCPLVTQNLREVQDLLGDRVGRDIFMYSITLLPELETPTVLRDYADAWEAKPGWLFLTGKPDDIETLRVKLGFSSDPNLSWENDDHTGLVRYGNDRVDRWTGGPALGRPAWIVKAVTSIASV